MWRAASNRWGEIHDVACEFRQTHDFQDYSKILSVFIRVYLRPPLFPYSTLFQPFAVHSRRFAARTFSKAPAPVHGGTPETPSHAHLE